MTDYYMDTDTGDDADNGTTWALAKLTFEGLLAVMSVGDRGFIQGAAVDTAAASRTFSFPANSGNQPVMIIGVQDGTTAEPPVAADLARRGTHTLTHIEVTGAGNDMNFGADTQAVICGLKFSCPDRLVVQGTESNYDFYECELAINGRLRTDFEANSTFYDCEFEFTATGAAFNPIADLKIRGGELLCTADPNNLFSITPLDVNSKVDVIGFDMSDWTAGNTLFNLSAGSAGIATFKNCRMPSSYTTYSGTVGASFKYIELINCDSTTSVTDTDSRQSYYKFNGHGLVENESTIVRTGGADDGASGGFSYKLTPDANATLEGTNANVASPELVEWVPAGSQTVEIYFCNDGGVDYNEDEIWCKFFAPDSADTAQHELFFDDSYPTFIFPSTTAVTDDTVSVWGGAGANGQKFSIAINPGYEGLVYAKVFVAKRQATPDSVYLCPKMSIS